MTPLTKILLRQIERFGPISVAEYMTQCLLHPEHGYYSTNAPLGAKGDFITAPEISQMFGELIGLSLAQSWLDQGAPDPFCLAEFGPGKGTLMADILRATKSVPTFHSAMHLVLIEVSPTLQEQQKETLQDFAITWAKELEELPDLPLFFVANEFFDCLPIRQYRRMENAWQEQMIGASEGELCFILGAEAPEHGFDEHPVGTMTETSSAASAIAQGLARQIGELGGAGIVVDYGDWGSDGDTLQAVKDHTKIDLLTHAGNADLTAHVDFRALSNAIAPHANCSAMINQGVFLERLGITARAQGLAKNLQGNALENHISAHKRLTHPKEMGQLFKAIAITPRDAPPVAGF